MPTKIRQFFLVISAAALIGLPLVARATMSSANYTIYADSIGVSGGYASGTNYTIEQTLGEAAVASSTSASYTVNAGYQSTDREDLSLTISEANLALGTLSQNSVSSASTIATVSSLSASGYSLTVGAYSGNIEFGVNDTEVTAGSNEYGFAVSGEDKAFNGDKSVAVGQLVAFSTNASVNHSTTLTFKASRGTAIASQEYNQSITLQLSANF